ncbi:MAG: hypothetical protein ACYTF1_24220 [Planctomycetota bacterium]
MDENDNTDRSADESREVEIDWGKVKFSSHRWVCLIGYGEVVGGVVASQ